MQQIPGNPPITDRNRTRSGGSRKWLLGGLFGLSVALAPLSWFWGFTVDDALITARVATHLRAGFGYRFNSTGPVVDAVTPLGWAYVLALFARSTPLETLKVAKALGAFAWLFGAGWLGTQLAGSGERIRRFLPLALVVLSAPLAAWAASGMETGVITALGALAATRPRLSPLLGAVMSGLRPELFPWALVLGTGAELGPDWRWAAAARRAALVGSGPLFVALLRLAVFGTAVPLSVWAKPSDLNHGVRYALGALCFTGFAWLCLAPRAAAALERWHKVILGACLSHFLALILSGGDWMALYRLAVPIFPGLILVSSAIAERSTNLWSALRGLFAVTAMLPLIWVLGSAARGVGAARETLISKARGPLVGAARIATVDAGWVGAASTTFIFDLAGVTNPAVGRLPGGHTSKQIPPRWLESPRVDTLVLLLAPGSTREEPWYLSRFARGVESRIARFENASEFQPITELPLPGTNQRYLVLRRPLRESVNPR